MHRRRQGRIDQRLHLLGVLVGVTGCALEESSDLMKLSSLSVGSSATKSHTGLWGEEGYELSVNIDDSVLDVLLFHSPHTSLIFLGFCRKSFVLRLPD